MTQKKQNIFFNYLILMFTILLLNGCGSDPVQKDLINYINIQVLKFASLEVEMSSDYESVTGDNYKDDITSYKTITESVQPKCIKITDILENKISPKTSEVIALHEIYIDSYSNQCSAFLIMGSAIEKGDYELIAKANTGLSKARKLQRQWLNKLSELKKTHNVLTKTK